MLLSFMRNGNLAARQQQNGETGHRAYLCRYSLRNSLPNLYPTEAYTIGPRSCMVFLESRGYPIRRHYPLDSRADLETVKRAYGLQGVRCSPTNHPAHYGYGGKDLPAGEVPFNLMNLREHDGEITYQSSPGEGATFIITLPLRRSASSTEHVAVSAGES